MHAHANYGAFLHLTGKYTMAEKEYSKVLEINPSLLTMLQKKLEQTHKYHEAETRISITLTSWWLDVFIV